MPSLPSPSGLPNDLWDLVVSIYDAMSSFLWYFTAFLASSAVLPNGGLQGVAAQYLLGLGIGDITGPVVETNMMGYADLAQVDRGLHMRERSRAFIVADAAAPNNRIVFINADIAMGDTGVRRSIVAQLSSQFPGVYTDTNIAFVSTHSHAGVGGYLENLLPQVTSLGYVKQTADAIVAGTVLAVRRAHQSLAPGRLRVGNATVLNANINRSPTAYLANPAQERARYQYDQDKEMTVLRFDDNNGNARGLLSFFPVHCTSLYQNNTLVSGDNKGMAAFLYESFVEPNALPGNTTFVAGFTQSNVGDTSPNTLGPICQSPGKEYDGQPCDPDHSTCGGTVQDCRGRGPGFRISDFESNRIIGQLQFEGAQGIMNGPLSPVQGSVKSVHAYVAMANHSFQLSDGRTVSTCPAAMGYAFAGGTTDGPGAADFIQGSNTSTTQNPFWEIVKGAITPVPSAAQKACQDPKPILLNTGYAHWPYEWAPNTVDVQILRAGNFGEFTTMAGRRIRANTSGKPSPTRAEHVHRDLNGKVGLILDGGACGVGLESTVVDGLHDDGNIRVLRPGGITVEDIEGALRKEIHDVANVPKVLVHKRDYADEKIEAAPTTPGMKYRHYSPSVPVTLLSTLPSLSGTQTPIQLSEYIDSLRTEDLKIGVLAATDSMLWNSLDSIDGVTWYRYPLGPTSEPSVIAHRLFDGLLTLEKDGVHRMLIEEVDETREGLAVMNRVRKAASDVIRVTLN
ncbi:hypothetical protein NLJ89_g9990 [Agrocybe chaxingu]|uniref:Neutral ceramidase n=1 Tax=Agrocybe chaxingu TaxID=84603 RepID=A0A9W8JS08_9AGAR|nr:hypothetical protein NLJ89_g9990 [Agrocybe chaxingu]